MSTAISANLGQAILLAVEVLDNTNTRLDGYAPTLDFVRNPDGTELVGTTSMTRIDVGLYQVSVALPSAIAGLGTYIGSASWAHPNTAVTQYELFIINVALAFGNSSVSPG